MATPRRSSSRLRHSGATPAKLTATPSRLTALVEREETPEHGKQRSIDALTSPHLQAQAHVEKTPIRSAVPRPATEEMHPGSFQSAAKKLASEQRFGFDTNAFTTTPTKTSSSTAVPKTAPSKSAAGNPFASASFEFRYARPSSELSEDAKRLMDDVRGHAAQIRQQLEAARDEQTRQDDAADAMRGTRKIATAKGKIGRFSDVHLEQFKKMDSIANHASSFRADTSRPSSAKKSLKRTNSKAKLDEDVETPKSAQKAIAPKSVDGKVHHSAAKRVKKADDTGSATEASTPSKLPTAKPTSTLNRTPSKMPPPRFVSSKNVSASKTSVSSGIPRTPSKTSLSGASSVLPSVPQTDPSNKRRSTLGAKFSSMKSILRKPQLRFSDDPLKQAAGTHVPPKESSSDGPGVGAETPSTRPEKQVSFSPAPHIFGTSHNKEPASPTPAKKAIVYPNLRDGATAAPGNRPAAATRSKVISPPGGPKDFTFRAGQSISFASEGKPGPATPLARKSSQGRGPTSTGGLGQLSGLPSVPHGLSNKKRKRQSFEETSEDKENQRMKDDEQPEQSPAKRTKTAPIPFELPKMPGKVHTDKAGTSKKKSVLSLTRLQELAKPKSRK